MEKDLGACLRPGQAALEMTDYGTLNARLSSLIKGVPHPTANLANAAALLYHTLDGLNWAGFYLLEGDTLVLGPFQGKPACIEIPLGRGVCGAALSIYLPEIHFLSTYSLMCVFACVSACV